MIPRQHNEPRPTRDDWIDELYDKNRGAVQLCAAHWATVDQVAELVAMCTADAVIQILKGEVRYYGLQYERPERFVARAVDRTAWRRRYAGDA